MNHPPDHLRPERTAFFLDFDGTLAEIVDDPARARVPSRTLSALAGLAQTSGGALAVVSGRSIAELDRMLHPEHLPLAGVHGLERRSLRGELVRTAIDADLHQRLVAAVGAFADERPGLLSEPKPGSVALHYRRRPKLESACLAFARELARQDRRIRLLPGKMVIEMSLASQTKGDAIAAFMAAPPFLGRQPFFAGDDVTDEAGFAVVNMMGGLSLKIGSGDSLARYRLPDPAAFTAYLVRLWEEALSRRNPPQEGNGIAR